MFGKRFATLATIGVACFLLVAAACSSTSPSSQVKDQGYGMAGPQGPQGPAGPTGVPAATTIAESNLGLESAGGAPAAVPAPTMAPAATPTQAPQLTYGFAQTASKTTVSTGLDQQIAQATSSRVIVRNAKVSLEVADVGRAIDAITQIAQSAGGWVVSSQQSSPSAGQISIRVPAQGLESALDQVKGVAAIVKSVNVSSQDFTKQYTDLKARIANLQATRDALQSLLDKAQTVDEALKVQEQLSTVQGNLESLQGQAHFIEQSAAFSLIDVTLQRQAGTLQVDAGSNRVLAVGEPAQFRVHFSPPDGIDQFTITWDFGDGTGLATTRTQALGDGNQLRLSPEVTHAYKDDTNSPYTVNVKVTGEGNSGEVTGTSTLQVTVSPKPVIQVFAGNAQTAQAGDVVILKGSFTRPSGFHNVTYTWDFGDGSTPQQGSLADSASSVQAQHVYVNYRPQAYHATLTISGQSNEGAAKGESSVAIQVVQASQLGASWDPGSSSRSATHALANVGTALGKAGIWIGIFSPIWLVLAVIAFFAWRMRRKGGHAG